MEKAQLEDELRQKEKRMLCLTQAFPAKTAEFRETLSAILGVKVTSYDNEQVRSRRSMISVPHSSFSLYRGTPPRTVAAVGVRERRGCSSLRREREGRRNCLS